MGFADRTRAERHSAAGRAAMTSRARATITSTWSSVSCTRGASSRRRGTTGHAPTDRRGDLEREYGLEVLLQSRDLGDTSGGEAGRARARRRCADQTALHRSAPTTSSSATPGATSHPRPSQQADGSREKRQPPLWYGDGTFARPDACAPTSRVARYARSHPGSDRRVARRQAPPTRRHARPRDTPSRSLL